jgi:hypothetical protein
MSRHSYRLPNLVDLNAACARIQRQRRTLEKRAVAGDAPQGGPEIAIYACPELTAYRRPGLLKSVALRLVSLDERRDL